MGSLYKTMKQYKESLISGYIFLWVARRDRASISLVDRWALPVWTRHRKRAPRIVGHIMERRIRGRLLPLGTQHRQSTG